MSIVNQSLWRQYLSDSLDDETIVNYADWLEKECKALQESRSMVKELVAEVRTLIAPMNELLPHGDGPEADRVFPQYEFDALRTLIAKAEAMT